MSATERGSERWGVRSAGELASALGVDGGMLSSGAIDCAGIKDPVGPFDDSPAAYERYVDRNPERAIKLGVRF